MGIPCCCCNAKNSKRAAEPHKRAADDAKRYREEIEKKRKWEELEIHAKQLFHKVKTTQD